jgi:mono/diheme cytochrome c family protein
MNEQEKQEYLESYKVAKEKGVPFFPDILFKDAVVVLVIFLILAALASFLGAPLEARANPADTAYTPRPEWYFLFLFQLLKYFPGSLEFLGVVVLPTLAILGLFLLPFLDRKSKRYYRQRPLVIGFTTIVVAAILLLTFLAYREAPPPAQAKEGDQTAALYAKNCAPCHGSSIAVAPGTDLHNVIAQGKHEGMPPWSADLTTDQIDALAGFILSPAGSKLFTDNCGACHQAPELVAGSPIELKNALDQGPNYPAHKDANVPDWSQVLNSEELTKLLNFLVAPDGQRLFAINCAPCHGTSIAFSGDENQLRTIISQGGKHLEMPPWQEKLSSSELDTLANYVVNPTSTTGGDELFKKYCSSCHGERIPAAQDVSQARQIIATGGSHETMPVWGDVLTPEQLTALTNYTLESAKGTPIEVGQQLFDQNCTSCHGDLGEGGPNPTRPGDIIAPISTAEYLKTRDDFTLKAIISQGQPDFGMSPFGLSNGGPLDDDQIDTIVAFMRSWEANPPVELPPEVASAQVALSAAEVFSDICAQCHGPNGEGGIGPSLIDPKFQSSTTDQTIFDSIKMGHPATPMIGWGDVLSDDQIQQLVGYIREFGQKQPSQPTEQAGQPTEQPAAPTTPPTFVADIQPIFKSKCVMCHGSLGGWDASSYEKVMTTGDNAPVVISGDPDGSLLAQKLLDTQTIGAEMPPGSKLPDAEIQLILDWIAAGAPEN